MNRLTWWILAAALVLPGCKHQEQKQRSEIPEGGIPRMASTIKTNDGHTAGQLNSGFYGIENGAWRWTGKQFAMTLGVPPGAAQKGGLLQLKLSVPQVSIDKLQSVTLSGAANGSPLTPETYSKSGQYTYEREIPASALAGDSVTVSFQLDKAMAPAGGDVRELGVIVSGASLLAK